MGVQELSIFKTIGQLHKRPPCPSVILSKMDRRWGTDSLLVVRLLFHSIILDRCPAESFEKKSTAHRPVEDEI